MNNILNELLEKIKKTFSWSRCLSSASIYRSVENKTSYKICSAIPYFIMYKTVELHNFLLKNKNNFFSHEYIYYILILAISISEQIKLFFLQFNIDLEKELDEKQLKIFKELKDYRNDLIHPFRNQKATFSISVEDRNFMKNFCTSNNLIKKENDEYFIDPIYGMTDGFMNIEKINFEIQDNNVKEEIKIISSKYLLEESVNLIFHLYEKSISLVKEIKSNK